jgi:hypothetical protein
MTKSRSGSKRKINDSVDSIESLKPKKTQSKMKRKSIEDTTAQIDIVQPGDDSQVQTDNTSTKKSPSHQVLTVRHDLPKLWGQSSQDSNSYSKFSKDIFT